MRGMFVYSCEHSSFQCGGGGGGIKILEIFTRF